ncbi:MAG: nucleoside kinase [Chloroflexota bacterium]
MSIIKPDVKPVDSVNSIEQSPVSASSARTDARVMFPGGVVYSAPVGTPLLEYVNVAFPPEHPDRPVMGAVVDNELKELTYLVQRDVTIQPVTLTHSDGSRIYRRSLVFLLTTAAGELFPGIKIDVQHSLTSGGFYCEVLDRANFTAPELDMLRDRMVEIVHNDEPITRRHISLTEARALFEARGDDDKVRLLEYREKNYLSVYTLRGNTDYFFGYMAASTGSLTLFGLVPNEEGFILQYPQPEQPEMLHPYSKSSKLESVFIRTQKWLEVMGIEDIGRLNESIVGGHFREEVLIAEALQNRHLDDTARMIAERHAQGMRLVLIAGPSSAGKTTFSKRLAVQLMAYGLQPFALAMDNYFVDRDLTPRDETGAYDFEALEALNRTRLSSDLLGLMQRDSVQLPHFDFKLGRSVSGESYQLTDDHVIIAEGIHGLNPNLLPDIAPDRIFRIYVSALTALNLDRHNRIPTTDVRLLRRIVRDAAQRGYSAEDTLNRWESVRRGEKRNIFPFQENADFMFNSSLVYELAVIRPFAEPLLLQVDRTSLRYVEVKRLLAFLSWVRPTSAEFVPDDSLLREFVGGSILETYIPGLRQNTLKHTKPTNATMP